MQTRPGKLKFKTGKRKQTNEESSVAKKSKAIEEKSDSASISPAPSIRQRDDWMQPLAGPDNHDQPSAKTAGRFMKEDEQSIVPNDSRDVAADNGRSSNIAPSLKDEYTVSYEFGDSGSAWRLMKLAKVYQSAKERNTTPEIVALERFGNLLDFDIAREEQKEMEDRKVPGHSLKLKPTGTFYHKRQFADVPEVQPQSSRTDQDLNELKAKVLKAKLQKSSDYAKLQAEYDALTASPQTKSSDKNSKDMSSAYDSLTSLVEEEKLSTSHKDLIRDSVKSILKDKKFDSDLNEQDEKLDIFAKNIRSGKVSLAGGLDEAKKLNESIGKCALCFENNRPLPIVYKSTRFALALAPHPSLVEHSAMIFPLEHRKNSLEFDAGDRREFKAIMITLSRFYHEKLKKKVIFYETSAQQFRHCYIIAAPLSAHISDDLIFDHFKNGIIEESNDLEQQHKMIDSRHRSYDNFLTTEAPYFHLWINLTGGIGHIIEGDRWPAGDLFARRVLGGLLKMDKFDVERKTRFYAGHGVHDKPLEEFKGLYKGYEWTT